MKPFKFCIYLFLTAIVVQACTSTPVQMRHMESVGAPITNSELVFASIDSSAIASCCSENDAGRCVGKANCTACSNCSQCAYCNSGGSCGVCTGGSYRNSSSGNGSSTYTRQNSTSSIGKGQVSFWTDIPLRAEIEIYIDGIHVGSLESYFPKGVPQCGQDGTVTVSMPVGKHSLKAKYGGMEEWSGTVLFVRSGCKTFAIKE